ncbi:MAG TPA: Holliday junction branch migration protein RuvA [Parachlamydiales bacterium]|nr:Holliday junction branch migration protein RuvA [Parachlamydiales bacterium]
MAAPAILKLDFVNVMYDYLKGRLVSVTLEKAVIEVGGIGYAVCIPFSTFSKLPKQGEEAFLYTSLMVREDSQKLYGFWKRGDRDLFELLDSVSGIGPKTALALIGHMERDLFELSIAQGDLSALCKVPGIGKKTAERLLIEMKDKLKRSPLDLPLVSGSGPQDTLAADAVSALIHLGYPAPHAQKAVQRALEANQQKPNLADLITATLRAL